MGVGIKCKLYRDTAYPATAVWDEVPIVGDFTLNIEPQYATAATRETPVERGLVTGYKVSGSGKMRVATGADFAAFQAAAVSGGPVNCLILNGAQTVVGATGVMGPFLVTKWGEDQAIAGIVMKDFELMPYLDDDVTKIIKVATVGGTEETPVLAFTDFDV